MQFIPVAGIGFSCVSLAAELLILKERINTLSFRKELHQTSKENQLRAATLLRSESTQPIDSKNNDDADSTVTQISYV